MSDRVAWLEQWCPECHAAPGRRCGLPSPGLGIPEARNPEPAAPHRQGLARASLPDVLGSRGRAMLDTDRP